MARRRGRLGDYLATDDYSGRVTYASRLKRDPDGFYAEKPLSRNLQEIASPLNDPRPVSLYRPPNYEDTSGCIASTAPIFVGNTTVRTHTLNAAIQAMDLDPAIPDMEIGCTFVVR